MVYYSVIIILLIAVALFLLSQFRPKPTKTVYDFYSNSRFYRLLVMIIIGIIALIVAVIKRYWDI